MAFNMSDNVRSVVTNEIELWLNSNFGGTIVLLEISGDEVDSCTVNLLLASEFEVKLHVPTGYPRHDGCFRINSDSIIHGWTKEVNEFLIDPGVQKLSICDVLDKLVELFSSYNQDMKESLFQDEADKDDCSAECQSSEIDEDIICDDDDDDSTFTTDWDLKITRKKSQWALKEPFFRQMMRKKRTRQEIMANSAQQVFTSSAASGILTNDLVRIMEYEKTCGFSADAIEDNIFHWQVRLNKFSPDSDLTRDLQCLLQKHGYDYIEMEMTFEIDLYPFYPPLVKVLRPRLKNCMMQRITNIEFLQLSYWSPTRDMKSVIDGIKDFLQQYARIDLNGDINDLSRSPYQNIEHYLLTLAQVSEVIPRASYQSLLDKDQLKELQDTTTHHQSRSIINYGIDVDQDRCWAKGTGYGHDSRPDWDINVYIASQRERDNQIESNLTEILNELKTFPVSLPSDTSNILLPSLDAVGCVNDEWEQSYDVTSSNCRMNAEKSYQDFMTDMFIALEGSALVPFIEQLLTVDSFLEISRHSVVYILVVNILQEICYRRELLPLLCSLPNQTMSIYEHLEHFNILSSKMLNQIRKPANGHAINQGLDAEGSDSSEDNDIAVNCMDTFKRMKGKSKLTKTSNPWLVGGYANQLTADEKLARGFVDVFNNVTRCLEDTNLISTCRNSLAEVAAGGDAQVNHCKTDSVIETVYNETMKKFLFKTCNIPVFGQNCHYFAEAYSGQHCQACKTQVIRIAQEHLSLSTSLPLDLSSAVFVRYDEEHIPLMQALITGPADTPYSSGCFLFDIYFPYNYPIEPPKVHLNTTGNNKVRFNPNLYNCGKVCLSLLGTWHGRNGEKWNEKTSTILQVLVSIQSLILVSDPYFNEPGFEKIINTDDGKRLSDEYNKDIQLNCIKYAMIDQLTHPPPGFEDVIQTHFFLKRDLILKEVQEWYRSNKCSQMEVAVSTLKKELMKLTPPVSAQ